MRDHPFWIRNATFLNNSGETSFGHLWIHEGQISKITQDDPVFSANEKCIDASNQILLPGLINSHTHLPMVMFRGLGDGLPLQQWLNEIIFPLEAQWSPEEIYLSTMLAIAECIHSGCTCIADMYFFIEEIARAVHDTGIRAALSLGLVQANGDKGLAQSEKIFHDLNGSSDGRITIHLAPHAIYTCPPSFLKEIIDLAKNLNAKLHIHLNETQREIIDHVAQYKKNPIETMADLGMFDLSVLAAHCVFLSTKEIEILKKAKDILVVHCPSSNMKLASGIAPISQLRQLGIPVSIGTDGAASNNNLNMFFELRLASLLAKVSNYDATALPAKEIIAMGTTIPGKFLGPCNLGSIQEKAPADLILINTHQSHCLPSHDLISNIVFAMNSSEVDTMIVNGRIIMQNKLITSFDEERIKKQFILSSKKYKAMQ